MLDGGGRPNVRAVMSQLCKIVAENIGSATKSAGEGGEAAK